MMAGLILMDDIMKFKTCSIHNTMKIATVLYLMSFNSLSYTAERLFKMTRLKISFYMGKT